MYSFYPTTFTLNSKMPVQNCQLSLGYLESTETLTPFVTAGIGHFSWHMAKHTQVSKNQIWLALRLEEQEVDIAIKITN